MMNNLMLKVTKKISYQIKNAQLELTTDAGVFSKDNVDFGSDLLIKTF